jgi:hypothetical protein
MTKSRIQLATLNSSSSYRAASSLSLFLKKQLWIWPLIAGALLFAVGYWLRSAVDRSLKENVADELQVLLNADVAALSQWFGTQEATAKAAVRDDDVLKTIHALVELDEKKPSPLAVAESQQFTAIKEALRPWMEIGSFHDFVVFDPQLKIIGSTRAELIGKEVSEYSAFAKRALAGQTLVSPPFRSVVMLRDGQGKLRVGVPTMFVSAPIRSSDGKDVIAALAFRINPEAGFTKVLQLARMGKSGETYAFDRNGLMLSQSRFDPQLKEIGLLPQTEEASSTLTLELRDPGADLTLGKRPIAPRSQQPLILPVKETIGRRLGTQVEGHRDYRGVPQVAAWTWLEKYGIGVVIDVDYAEAMAPLRIVDLAFWSLFGLLAAMSLAIFAFSFVVARLQLRVQQAAIKQQKLGQYRLEEKLGEGGMGAVYRGYHALLRRPTAIKLLDIKKTNESTIARFEREVQLTSHLNHPNTIAIYDFGRTAEGIFYYAMEFLDGLDLERLVAIDGPLSEGRAIHILLQVCGSLAEAHEMGLVHRDIKPANILVGRHGGMADFVKVVDFGLIKAIDDENAQMLTAADSIAGTPMYISPEGIENPNAVDARSDLYALGAVGYFLITGTRPFDAKNVVELCMKVVNTAPEPPSQRLGKPVSAELEAVLLCCLAKKQSDRFASAEELAAALRACPAYGTWSPGDAAVWWKSHSTAKAAAKPTQSATPTPNVDAHTNTMVWVEERA